MRNVSKYLSKTVWTESDVEFLTTQYIQLSHSELAERLSRTISEIKYQIKKLELKLTPEQKLLKKQAAAYKMQENKSIDKRWSQEEIDYLKEHYPHTETKNLVSKMGRSIYAIIRVASNLKIRKTPEFMEKLHAEIIPATEGHKKFVRPSQSLSRAYILVNILHKKNTSENLLLFDNDIKIERQRILHRRIDETPKMV